ncbi:hypothetical protein BD769DRAFT_1724192 [Suillus cothurnatus]|nr:hypothetical protein BD769DRAFT_1724192 [Suillus cothurnatus]
MSTKPPTDFSAETLIRSFMTIILSEIGDKTFFISAILAMRHPRLPGRYCFPSLALMSMLSASLGDGEKGEGKVEEEMREAEEEIDGDRFDAQDAIPLQRLEEEEVVPSSPNARKQEKLGWGIAEGARNFCSLILGPVFVQSFVLTFLGEWGDRSQIATIALCAALTVLGHTCCTALAVVGGRYVSSKISVKYVTLGGTALFLIFGIILSQRRAF